MKLTLLLGHSGTGKTYQLIQRIRQDAEAGRQVFLLVPEQQSFSAERRILNILPPSSQLYVEVLSFSRLANRVFRQYGGLSYHYATPGVRALLMWNSLRELSGLLEEYHNRSVADTTLTETLLSAVEELKAYSISAGKLESVARKLPDKSPLRARLMDISLLYAAFQNSLEQQYDDATEDLSRLDEVLKTHDFFRDTCVYLDFFTSFTPVEYRILSHIFVSAANVTMTLGCQNIHENQPHLMTLTDTLNRLYQLAEQYHCRVEQLVLTENHRAQNRELATLEDGLWRLEQTDFPPISQEEQGHVHLWHCTDPYEEADAAAALISSLVQGGTRYRDIVVICRNTEDYRGILDASLEKFQIPAFFAEKTDLSSLPPIKLIQSALRIVKDDFRTGDIISHIKTGLIALPQEELDAFESYITTWRLRGRDFLKNEWTMNPEGYVASDRISERNKKVLAYANHVREVLVPPLTELKQALTNAADTPTMCQAIYQYLETVGMKETLRLQATKLWDMGAGERVHAAELIRLYDVVLDVLEDVSHALSDVTLTPDEFATAIKLVFDRTDIASIPDTADQVLVGSASMLRTDEPRIAILLGLCEDIFPRSVVDDGVFSDSDKAQLRELGLTLSSDTGARSSDELYYVYRAMTAPSEELYLLTSDSDCDGRVRRPSMAFLRVKKLLPHCQSLAYAAFPPSARLWHPEAAFETLPDLCGTPEQAALKSLFSQNPAYAARLEALSIPVSQPDCAISPETARIVFPRRLSLTQTRLENYVLCHFHYYCSFILGLKDEKPAQIRYNDIGTFIHSVLEAFFRQTVKDGQFCADLTDGEIETLVDNILQEYLTALCPKDTEPSNRLRHLFLRLRRLSLLMIKNLIAEFSHSAFTPAFFELNIRDNSDGMPSPMELHLENGETVSLRGIIDRVDLFHQGNDLYIRVVDYKTGTKEFSMEDVRQGLNVQLLLYLFTLLENSPPAFREKLGLRADGKLLPAGVLYLTANVPPINIDRELTPEEVQRLAQQKLARHGLVLDDPLILEAMNDQLSPEFLGDVKMKASRSKKPEQTELCGNGLVSSEDFARIGRELKDTIRQIATSMKQGRADAKPNVFRDHDPCSFCDMKAVCRCSTPGRN